MPTVHLTRIEDLGPALAEFLPRALSVLTVELRDTVGEHALLRLVDLSPVGAPAVDPHSGKYRASHVPAAGQIKTVVLPNLPAYPVPGIPEVNAASQGAGPEVSLFIANAAADERRPDQSYAGLLEGGRRQYSSTRTGRVIWIGSEQAPEGIYGPTVEQLKGERVTIEAEAVERTKRRLG